MLLTLPEAAGGNGQLSYELRPEVPGLTFDRGNRTLSGTPRIVDTYRMSYRVSDADDNTADSDGDTLTFTITVREGDTAPTFTEEVSDQSYTVGEEISLLALPEASGGNGPLSYELRPEVPGLTFDRRTRTVSGTPRIVDTYRMSYRVSDADVNEADGDADTLTFTITVWPIPSVSGTYRGSGDQVFAINGDGQTLAATTYALRLGAARPEVYLIATNTNSYSAYTRIQRLGAAAVTESQGLFADVEYPSRSIDPDPIAHAPPWIVEFNNNPPRLEGSGRPRRSLRPQVQRAVTEGDRFTFISRWESTNVAVPAAARRVVSDGSTTLVVWIADRQWSRTCRVAHQCMTREMVDVVADTFLRPGDGNDIYDWVTAIFGDAWGRHDYPNLIPPESSSQVHILFFDIAGDGVPSRGQTRTGGYFHGVNNYLRADDPILRRASNERLMFFMDAPLMAHREGPTWEVTDRYPSGMISTLAHEFQHMIHFYQKGVLRGGQSEAWLNEMASEVAEDLIADKLSVPGPRGVLDDPTAGEAGNWRGRLAGYNFYNYIQVTAWDRENALKHYAINYALGAYLARTYGGAALFGDIVASGLSGVDAVETALRRQGHYDSFGDVLQNWGIANLLSDNPRAPSPYRYNSGGWSISRSGGETYRLGSINLYHYRYYYGAAYTEYLDGPILYQFQQFSDGLGRHPHSNAYTALGRMTGTVRLRISADAGVRIAVVVKE